VVGKKKGKRESGHGKKGGKGTLEPLAEVNPVSSSVLLLTFHTRTKRWPWKQHKRRDGRGSICLRKVKKKTEK
jgi:hypothetical protein